VAAAARVLSREGQDLLLQTARMRAGLRHCQMRYGAGAEYHDAGMRIEGPSVEGRGPV
jgi:hypothetical protein